MCPYTLYILACHKSSFLAWPYFSKREKNYFFPLKYSDCFCVYNEIMGNRLFCIFWFFCASNFCNRNICCCIKLIRTLNVLEGCICFSNQDKGFLHIPKWINDHSHLNLSLLSYFLSWHQQAKMFGIALNNTLTLATAKLLWHTFSLFYLLPNLTPFSPSLIAKWTDLGLEITLMWCVLLLQLLRRCPLIYRLKLPLQLRLTFYIWPLALIISW